MMLLEGWKLIDGAGEMQQHDGVVHMNGCQRQRDGCDCGSCRNGTSTVAPRCGPSTECHKHKTMEVLLSATTFVLGVWTRKALFV